jgi:hypothetical protein
MDMVELTFFEKVLAGMMEATGKRRKGLARRAGRTILCKIYKFKAGNAGL